MEEGETVTWEATHFGIRQRLQVKMTRLERPHLFRDEMISGAFSSMSHQHRFEEKNGTTEMLDRFEFRAPLGLLGRIAEGLFLRNYIETFLRKRNATLKQIAESEQWKHYLSRSAKEAAPENGG